MDFKNNILKTLYSENELIMVSSKKPDISQFSGQGKKGVLIIIEEIESTDENLLFLSKIFGAMKLDLKTDTHLLKVKQGEIPNVSAISGFVNFSQIICFGMPPNDIGFHLTVQKYKPFRWQNYLILAADKLNDLQKDEKLKRSLWGILKNWKEY